VRTNTCPFFSAANPEVFDAWKICRSLRTQNLSALAARMSAQQALPLPSPTPSNTVVINAHSSLRTEADQRVIVVAGLPVHHYRAGDEVAEAYAMVFLVQSCFAPQTDVARAFDRSARTIRRYQERYVASGMAALGPGTYASCLSSSARTCSWFSSWLPVTTGSASPMVAAPHSLRSVRATTVTEDKAMANSAEPGPQAQAERRSMKASVARAHSTGWLAAA
jgi:hypothetical protein